MSRRTHTLTVDCPVAPRSKASPYTRTLRHACVIVGGVVALAAHLEVADPDLRLWLGGGERPPEAVFLAALEVVLLHLSESGPQGN
ncbi:MAG: hypothetical protein JO035_17030 [Betaproteobacteria bacterium]|nr:hypothetical protein [Betaproteobacteria bacterium]